MARFKQFLLEFEEDIKKKMLVLMGLPAAGKTTFVKDELKKIYSDFHSATISNSDAQLKSAQFDLSKHHYEFLVGTNRRKDQESLEQFIKDTTYEGKDGKPVSFKISLDDLKSGGKMDSHAKWWKEQYKPYYASYFDIRDFAKRQEEELFKEKITKSGNFLVIDSVGKNPEKIIKRLSDGKKEGFTTTIIYLEIDPKLCVERDKWRKENLGRGVGEKYIMAFAPAMDKAYTVYVNNGKKDDGVIDRLMHFVWVPKGDSPIQGKFVQKEDHRYSLEKKKKSIK